MNQLMKTKTAAPVYDRDNSVTEKMNTMYWLKANDVVFALSRGEYDVIMILSRKGIGYVFLEDLGVL